MRSVDEARAIDLLFGPPQGASGAERRDGVVAVTCESAREAVVQRRRQTQDTGEWSESESGGGRLCVFVGEN